MNNTLLALGDFTDAVDLIKMYGPFFVAAVFFLWRDWKREEKLSKRIDMLEDEQRQVILPLVRECSAVIAKNTAVMERLEKYLER
jgi:hypothetical protein